MIQVLHLQVIIITATHSVKPIFCIFEPQVKELVHLPLRSVVTYRIALLVVLVVHVEVIPICHALDYTDLAHSVDSPSLRKSVCGWLNLKELCEIARLDTVISLTHDKAIFILFFILDFIDLPVARLFLRAVEIGWYSVFDA